MSHKRKLHLECEKSDCDKKEGYLIDLDGTLLSGNHLMPGAKKLLSLLEERFVIVSNNSTETSFSLSKKLQTLGLWVSEVQILLAGQFAVKWLAENRRNQRIILAGSPLLREFARELNLNLVHKNPDVVLLARDVAFSYERLSLLANWIRNGSEFLVTNPDLTHPGVDRQQVIPETGALMQAVVACSSALPTIIFGKPEKPLLQEGLRRLGLLPQAVAMIGDNPQTDGMGALALGMKFIQIGDAETNCAKNPEELLHYCF